MKRRSPSVRSTYDHRAVRRGSVASSRATNVELFINGYFDEALIAESDDNGQPFDRNYNAHDFDEATSEKIRKDAEEFVTQHGSLIEDENREVGGGFSVWEVAGHDFWLTRNGHGAGFWDGDWPKHGDELARAAKSYGEFYLYVGDDGKIHGPPPGAYGVRENGKRNRQ